MPDLTAPLDRPLISKWDALVGCRWSVGDSPSRTEIREATPFPREHLYMTGVDHAFPTRIRDGRRPEFLPCSYHTSFIQSAGARLRLSSPPVHYRHDVRRFQVAGACEGLEDMSLYLSICLSTRASLTRLQKAYDVYRAIDS